MKKIYRDKIRDMRKIHLLWRTNTFIMRYMNGVALYVEGMQQLTFMTLF